MAEEKKKKVIKSSEEKVEKKVDQKESTKSPEKKKIPTPKFLKKIKFKGGRFLVIILVAILLVFITTVGVLIYTRNNESVFVKRVAQVVPYPAAIADFRYISVANYLYQLDILKNYYREFENTDFNSEEGRALLQELRGEVLERMI